MQSTPPRRDSSAPTLNEKIDPSPYAPSGACPHGCVHLHRLQGSISGETRTYQSGQFRKVATGPQSREQSAPLTADERGTVRTLNTQRTLFSAPNAPAPLRPGPHTPPRVDIHVVIVIQDSRRPRLPVGRGCGPVGLPAPKAHDADPEQGGVQHDSAGNNTRTKRSIIHDAAFA
jgi:hypothetical protein